MFLLRVMFIGIPFGLTSYEKSPRGDEGVLVGDIAAGLVLHFQFPDVFGPARKELFDDGGGFFVPLLQPAQADLHELHPKGLEAAAPLGPEGLKQAVDGLQHFRDFFAGDCRQRFVVSRRIGRQQFFPDFEFPDHHIGDVPGVIVTSRFHVVPERFDALFDLPVTFDKLRGDVFSEERQFVPDDPHEGVVPEERIGRDLPDLPLRVLEGVTEAAAGDLELIGC